MQNLSSMFSNGLLHQLLTLLLFASLSALPVLAKERHRGYHPIHISLTTVDYNAKSNALEIACKIFADDLETVVNRTSNTTLKLGSDKEHKDANALIFAYIKQHFRMDINGKSITTMTMLGKEMEVEATWMYIEIPLAGLGVVKKVNLTNTFLSDLYDDQTNLVNFNIAGKRKSAVFRKGKESSVVEFE